MTVSVTSALAVLLCSCGKGPAEPGDGLSPGTWGGKDAGLIVNDSTAHLHIGCTFGDFPADVAVDGGGHFSVAGDYVLKAFPIQIGPSLPAQFTGLISGNKVTLLVTVNDTVDDQVVIKGPVTVQLGREPQLGPCPICRNPRASGQEGTATTPESSKVKLRAPGRATPATLLGHPVLHHGSAAVVRSAPSRWF